MKTTYDCNEGRRIYTDGDIEVSVNHIRPEAPVWWRFDYDDGLGWQNTGLRSADMPMIEQQVIEKVREQMGLDDPELAAYDATSDGLVYSARELKTLLEDLIDTPSSVSHEELSAACKAVCDLALAADLAWKAVASTPGSGDGGRAEM